MTILLFRWPLWDSPCGEEMEFSPFFPWRKLKRSARPKVEEEKKSHKRISLPPPYGSQKKKVGRVHFWAQKEGGARFNQSFPRPRRGKEKTGFLRRCFFWSGKRREMKVRHRIFSSAFSLGGGWRVRAIKPCPRQNVRCGRIFMCQSAGCETNISGGESQKKRHYVFHSRPFFLLLFVNLKVRSCSAERGKGCRVRGIRGIRHLPCSLPSVPVK